MMQSVSVATHAGSRRWRGTSRTGRKGQACPGGSLLSLAQLSGGGGGTGGGHREASSRDPTGSSEGCTGAPTGAHPTQRFTSTYLRPTCTTYASQ